MSRRRAGSSRKGDLSARSNMVRGLQNNDDGQDVDVDGDEKDVVVDDKNDNDNIDKNDNDNDNKNNDKNNKDTEPPTIAPTSTFSIVSPTLSPTLPPVTTTTAAPTRRPTTLTPTTMTTTAAPTASLPEPTSVPILTEESTARFVNRYHLSFSLWSPSVSLDVQEPALRDVLNRALCSSGAELITADWKPACPAASSSSSSFDEGQQEIQDPTLATTVTTMTNDTAASSESKMPSFEASPPTVLWNEPLAEATWDTLEWTVHYEQGKPVARLDDDDDEEEEEDDGDRAAHDNVFASDAGGLVELSATATVSMMEHLYHPHVTYNRTSSTASLDYWTWNFTYHVLEEGIPTQSRLEEFLDDFIRSGRMQQSLSQQPWADDPAMTRISLVGMERETFLTVSPPGVPNPLLGIGIMPQDVVVTLRWIGICLLCFFVASFPTLTILGRRYRQLRMVGRSWDDGRDDDGADADAQDDLLDRHSLSASYQTPASLHVSFVRQLESMEQVLAQSRQLASTLVSSNDDGAMPTMITSIQTSSSFSSTSSSSSSSSHRSLSSVSSREESAIRLGGIVEKQPHDQPQPQPASAVTHVGSARSNRANAMLASQHELRTLQQQSKHQQHTQLQLQPPVPHDRIEAQEQRLLDDLARRMRQQRRGIPGPALATPPFATSLLPPRSSEVDDEEEEDDIDDNVAYDSVYDNDIVQNNDNDNRQGSFDWMT